MEFAFIGYVVTILIVVAAVTAGVVLFKKRKLTLNFIYEIPVNKELIYIPVDGGKSKVRYSFNAPSTNEVQFAPPVTDEGKAIDPYLIALVKNKVPFSYDAYVKATITLILQLVSKQALTLVYSTQSIPGISVMKNVEGLTHVEQELYNALSEYTKGHQVILLTNKSVAKFLEKSSFLNTLYEDVEQRQLLGRINVKLVKIIALSTLIVGAVASSFVSFTASLVLLAVGALAVYFASSLANGLIVVRAKTMGMLMRSNEFENYFIATRPKSRYSIEQSDGKGEYLPWAFVYNKISRWGDVFAQPYPQQNNAVVINDNLYDKERLLEALVKLEILAPYEPRKNLRGQLEKMLG